MKIHSYHCYDINILMHDQFDRLTLHQLRIFRAVAR